MDSGAVSFCRGPQCGKPQAGILADRFPEGALRLGAVDRGKIATPKRGETLLGGRDQRSVVSLDRVGVATGSRLDQLGHASGSGAPPSAT